MIEISENFSLKEYNTFGIDVTCKYFVKCDQESELLEFVRSYELDPEEILLLGGGSNFLFTEDFDGVVFYPMMQGCEIVGEDDEHVFVRVGSGFVWDDFCGANFSKYLLKGGESFSDPWACRGDSGTEHRGLRDGSGGMY